MLSKSGFIFGIINIVGNFGTGANLLADRLGCSAQAFQL
jgi:hypothetical protein